VRRLVKSDGNKRRDHPDRRQVNKILGQFLPPNRGRRTLRRDR
jgi:hypothetical protein